MAVFLSRVLMLLQPVMAVSAMAVTEMAAVVMALEAQEVLLMVESRVVVI